MKPSALLLGLALAYAAATHASDRDWLKLQGFGTIGVLHSNSNEADYVTANTQPNGAGPSRSYDWGVDSKLGVQADAFLIPDTLTATVQVLADQNYDNTFTPDVEWANLKYQITEGWYVRGGRTVPSFLMISDSRSVGYSQTMIRPPVDVYASSPINYLDGVDTGYRLLFDDFIVSTQLMYGRFKEKLVVGGLIFDSKSNGWMLNGQVEFADTTVRIAGSRFTIDMSNPMLDVYQQTMDALVGLNIPNADTIRRRTKTKGVNIDAIGIGFSHDPGDWVLQGEYTFRSTDSDFLEKSQAGYLLAGVRVRKFTPYLMFSEVRSKQDSPIPEMDALALPPPLQPVAYGVNQFVNGFNLGLSQKTYTLGVRYDFYQNMALKLQYDRVVKPANSFGNFQSQSMDFNYEKRTVDLVGLTIDLVF